MKKFFSGCIFLMLSLWLAGPASAASKKMPAPGFTLKDLQNVEVKLSEFKGKKPVVIFFWTTWCPYCVRALSVLERKAADYEKAGFAVIPINAGEPSAKVARFVKSKGYTFRIFVDPGSEVSDAYAVYGVPVYYLVDKSGLLRLMDNAFPEAEAGELVREK